MNTQEIIDQANDQLSFIKRIKFTTPYWPEFIHTKHGNEDYYSTIVRIKRNAAWYDIHVLESGFPGLVWEYDDMFKRLAIRVSSVQQLYKITPSDHPSDKQMEEDGRLMQLYVPHLLKSQS